MYNEDIIIYKGVFYMQSTALHHIPTGTHACPPVICTVGTNLKFRRLELMDREWLAPLLKDADSLSADGCFGTFYLWGEGYGLQIARLNGRVVLRYAKGKDMFYGYPVGRGDLRQAIQAMRSDAEKNGWPFRLAGVTEAQQKKLQTAFPGQFQYSEDRNTSDYIYTVTSLASLAGKKLHAKRNYCNRFVQNYPDWHFEPLTPAHFAACRKLLNGWEDAHETVVNREQSFEEGAIVKAFDAYGTLALDGGVLYVGSELVAFTFGERTGGNGFDVRFEKANTDFDGSYAMINREFSCYLQEKYPDLQYMNREEDMGLENLRKAKLSYRPEFLLTKYNACWNIEA